MDNDLVKEAIRHAESVRECQPRIEFDDLMFHVESNYPELSDDEELNVFEHLRDRYYPNVAPGVFVLEYRGACHVMIPMGN